MTIEFDSLFGDIGVDRFLAEYWQRKPLLIRQAIPGFESPIEPNELAGLSLEEEVESRIILKEGSHPWELRQGPFPDDTYQQLPERDWTLLVQAVDQFVPEVADLLAQFRFLPSWRVDDIMISYATPGGGVGPHYDNYDVFLLQGHGKRRWRIGQQCSEDSPLLENPDLRILAEFDCQDERVLEPGDMLYIPPGVAHDGVAETDCMTYSIGFRAPSHAEILVHFTDYLAHHLSDDQRYGDAGVNRPSDPAAIDPAAIDRLQQSVLRLVSDKEALATWFGRHMTEAKYPELAQAYAGEPEPLADLLNAGIGLEPNPAVRLAYWEAADGSLRLFANGEHCAVGPALLPLVQLICNQRYLPAELLLGWTQEEDAQQLLEQLVAKGFLLMERQDE
ncbi:cupin [Pseudomonas abyssi]|uniref:Cupin n=1 Tax=Pseudomonas abyssi TaxID=170540 RepID=A0A2A3MDV0_9PSED|nr:cupin domain-containing protein [Pseudomonas abyssi]MAC99224.1 cupin domain-containing protein [Pseudomonadales bacterium]PBK03010.1 cupin [Pseudomonas abyssi]|tara:strand:+ start:30568 stop:31740 length:1173 start_codon:yes stop_codon:yes gene_type:complete